MDVRTYSQDRRFGGMTCGGYSERIVADETFVVRVLAIGIVEAFRHECILL